METKQPDATRTEPVVQWRMARDRSEAYERYIVSAWMGEWAEALAATGGVEPGQRILDVACGTGIVARRAARLIASNGKIDGLDANRDMLDGARQFAERDGSGAIGWYEGDASRMPFNDAEYDLVLCQQGLQFFNDRPAALREMFRVLAPGGRLAISVWRSLERCPFLAVLADVFTRCFGERTARLLHAACSLADREELRSLLNSAGFRDVSIRLETRIARHASFPEFLRGYLSVFPISASIDAMPEIDRSEMFHAITTSLRDYMDDNGFAAPMEGHVVTASK